ncbi:MAG: fibronectin type III domain-containing protein [Syntrophobacteraceae bacterium]
MHGANLSKHLYGLFIFICVISLFPVFPLAANGATLANLAGTWGYNSFVSGPSAPWYERGTLKVSANGTLKGSGQDCYGDPADTFSGAFSFSSNGILMTGGPQGSSGMCQMDSDNNVLVCTDTWSWDGSANLIILTKLATSYQPANGVSNWAGNILDAGSNPWMATYSDTVGSSGAFSGTMSVDGVSQPGISGTLSLSKTGVVTCPSGCIDNYMGFEDAGKTITVGASGVSQNFPDAQIYVTTKQASSYSMTDLAGNWQNISLASGPGAYWWATGYGPVDSSGAYTGPYNVSNGSSGVTSGTLSISNTGAISCVGGDCQAFSNFSGVMDANKTVMVITYTWTDGTTQVIQISTKDAATGPGAPINVVAAAGNAQAEVTFTPPVSNDGPPITGYTVTSKPSGGVDQDGGTTSTIHNVTGLTNGTSYTFTVTASNADGNTTSKQSSNSIEPWAAPPSSLARLAGTWNFNNLTTGPDLPYWQRMIMTLNPDGTFTTSSTDNNDNVNNGNGTLWIFPNYGIVPTGGSNNIQNILCQIDSNQTVLACTQTEGDGSTALSVATKQATSNLTADLAGVWQGNYLMQGPDAGSATMIDTTDSQGNFTGTYTPGGGTSALVSGQLSISAGVVICTSSSSCYDPTFESFFDAGKNIMVGTGGANSDSTIYPNDAVLSVFTKQAASYSQADLAGTWQMNTIKSGPGAPYWERNTMTIGSTGTFTSSYTDSDGSTGSGTGKLSISRTGVITCVSGGCKGGGSMPVMDAGKTVMVMASTDTSSGALPYTGKISIFTKSTPAIPGAPTIGTATAGPASATISFTPPAFDGGSPITGYTVTSNPGGKTGKGTRSPITVKGLTNGASYTFTVTATNKAGTGLASGASSPVTPTK